MSTLDPVGRDGWARLNEALKDDVPTTIASAKKPRVMVLKSVHGPRWYWLCRACYWKGVDLHTQQAALREACRHLKEGCPR